MATCSPNKQVDVSTASRVIFTMVRRTLAFSWKEDVETQLDGPTQSHVMAFGQNIEKKKKKKQKPLNSYNVIHKINRFNYTI